MTRSKRSKLERNAKKIIPLRERRDHIGKYIDYCAYGNHQGILGFKKAEDCISKDCNHYRRYREDLPWSKK